MTDLLRPAVIPPVYPNAHAESAHWNQRGAPVPRAHVPLPAVPSKRLGIAVYGLSTLDQGGRIADRSVMEALGWEAGRRLEVRVRGGVIAVFTDDRGVFRVTAHRHLHLPIAARRWCGLTTPVRVLLAAYPDGGLLLVHPPAVLDQVVDQVFETVWGGGR